MKKIELNIIALSNSESQPGNYALVLEEQDGFRRLPLIIGTFEAQAIAISLERLQTNRPMTHDLFKNTLEALSFSLKEVIISDLDDGIFHAKLIGHDKENTIHEIDARSSDAIALAVRFGCPIYTTEKIMNAAGLVLDSPSKSFSTKRGSLAEYSKGELEQLLKQVLDKEDYESAAKIRDAIEKKS